MVASDSWKVLVEQQVVDSSLWEVKKHKARAHSKIETLYIFIGDIDHHTRKPLPFPDTQFRGQGPHVEFLSLTMAQKWVQAGLLEGRNAACEGIAKQVCDIHYLLIGTGSPSWWTLRLLIGGFAPLHLPGALHGCRQEVGRW
jgi:hypothetical protein